MHARRPRAADYRPARPARACMSGQPFNRCTHTALSPGRRHLRLRRLRQCSPCNKYRPEGEAPGSPGAGPGDRAGASSTCRTTSSATMPGWVYVADRESYRIQIFDGKGQWTRGSGPTCTGLLARCSSARASALCCYVGELGPQLPVNIAPHRISGRALGARPCKGKALSRFNSARRRLEVGVSSWSPHGHRGGFCAATFMLRRRPSSPPGRATTIPPPPEGVRCLQKYRRVT